MISRTLLVNTIVMFLFNTFSIPAKDTNTGILHRSDIYTMNAAFSYYRDLSTTQPVDSIYLKYTNNQFIPYSNGIANFGFSYEPIWLHCSAHCGLSESVNLVLDIAIPGLHYADFFIFTNDSLIASSQSGFSLNIHSRGTPFRNPSISFLSTPNTTYDFLIRIRSENPIIAPVNLREYDDYVLHDNKREFALGFLFGILSIMSFYHLFIFFSTREKSYLWLVLFTVTFGLGQITAVYGFLSYIEAFVPGDHLRWLHVLHFLAAYFGIILSREMLEPKKYTPICNVILGILQYFSLALVPITLFMSFMTAEKILFLPKLLPLPFLLYIAIVAIRKGHRNAFFYLFATVSFFFGLIVHNLMYGFNLLPFNDLTNFFPIITFIIMLLLFSFGIADKINILKREEAKAREQALFELDEKLKVQDEKAFVERELEQSRKMEAIGRLLSGIAHDMKNFLSPILGYAVLIRKQSKNDSGITDTSAKLVTATQKLNDLAMTLVNVSRKNAPGTEPLSINNLISQTASLIKHSSPSHIDIEIQLSPTDYSISANPGMIHSALLNLGVNAVDAMPDGGKVIIASCTESLDTNHPACSKFGINGGTFSTISVSDTGIGIDSRDLDYIFEPFFTKNKSGKGTGLGLTGVYNCVKVHGGCLDVQSEVGKGTTFRLHFPVREGPHQ